MGQLSFLDPMLIDQVKDEDIFTHNTHSEIIKIAKSKRDLILKLILDPNYKVNERKLAVYEMFKKGYSHSEISETLNISEQVSKNYNSEVNKKISSIAEVLSQI